jgi:hypothetical protein
MRAGGRAHSLQVHLFKQLELLQRERSGEGTRLLGLFVCGCVVAALDDAVTLLQQVVLFG